MTDAPTKKYVYNGNEVEKTGRRAIKTPSASTTSTRRRPSAGIASDVVVEIRSLSAGPTLLMWVKEEELYTIEE